MAEIEESKSEDEQMSTVKVNAYAVECDSCGADGVWDNEKICIDVEGSDQWVPYQLIEILKEHNYE